MAMIPSEILLEEILPKLPAKSLLRYKSISKQFQTLISSPNFILHHLRHSLSSSTNLLIITSDKSGLHLSDLDSPETPPIPLPLPEFFKPDPDYCIIGSCNGLLLLRGVVDFLLINPSTGFYSVIPGKDRTFYSNRFGFGYDAANDDYKIVVFDESQIVVANLRDKLWRNVDKFREDNVGNLRERRLDAAVYDNHLCHWLIWCALRNKHRIICFDLCIENWTQDIPLPDDKCGDNPGTSEHFAYMLFEECRDKRNDMTTLHVMNGFLSVLIENNTGGDGYDVWVMKEYGIKESWVKLFGFSDTPSNIPLAFGRGSSSKVLCKILRGHKRYGLKWYNVREKRYKDAEIHKVHGFKKCLYEVCVVNGSLVSVPGGKRIHDGCKVNTEQRG
ncbi:hypothetical protein KSS87_021129 [Heliosperma pusillum]|nr:hypothetical protein KSS87_021129 [Heliosperma pusillum]